ncbi:methyl-accepting chemotaxis protein [Silvimonas sp. JCM 19000]
MGMQSVRTKILLSYLFAAALLTAAAFIGLAGMQTGIQRYAVDVQALQQAQVEVLSMQVQFKIQVQEWKDYLLRGRDPALRAKHWGAFQKQEAAVQQAAAHLAQELPPGEAADLMRQFADAHKTLGEGYRKGSAAFEQAGFDSTAGDHAVAGIDRAPTTLLTKAVARIGTDASAIETDAHSLAQHQLYIGIGGMCTAIVVGLIGFFLLTTRSVINPLAQVTRQVESLTRDSDFTVRVDASGRDEIGRLGKALNECLAHIQHALQRLSVVSNGLADSARQLDGAAGQLADNAAQHNQHTGSIAAAVEEIAVSLAHTADQAQQAHALSQEAGAHTARSSELFERTAESITGVAGLVGSASGDVNALGQHSSEISTVADVIQSLAQQTNLLALNAAIEAARAGEHGRGFAVVADEVRKLAEHTTRSTGQIRQTIERIQQSVGVVVGQMQTVVSRVDECRVQASDAGELVRQLHQASAQIVSAMGEVANSVSEQSSANDAIANNVEHLAETSERNGASTSTAATQASVVNDMAVNARQIIAEFRI